MLTSVRVLEVLQLHTFIVALFLLRAGQHLVGLVHGLELAFRVGLLLVALARLLVCWFVV